MRAGRLFPVGRDYINIGKFAEFFGESVYAVGVVAVVIGNKNIQNF